MLIYAFSNSAFASLKSYYMTHSPAFYVIVPGQKFLLKSKKDSSESFFYAWKKGNIGYISIIFLGDKYA